MDAVEIRLLDPRLPGWGFPHRGSALAAGLDLHACLDEPLLLEPGSAPVLVSSGLAVRIGQAGWCAIATPRSGLGHRGLVLGNTLGVIDADYEGPVMLSCWNRNPAPDGPALTLAPGDRIAQLLFVPIGQPTLTVVSSFPDGTARGQNGFGSTGIGPAGGRVDP